MANERVLIFGACGMLGHDVVAAFSDNYAVTGVDIAEVDITRLDAVERLVKDIQPVIAINCAAYTNVDTCETDEKTAYAVNADGIINIGRACAAYGALAVHYSTDYVFDGKSTVPYREDDPTGPLGAYGRTKLAGELGLRSVCADHLILRTSWLFGKHGKNFVTTIQKAGREKKELRVVNDQTGSPTYAVDLARATRSLIEHQARGTFHATNSGVCTWYDFAAEIIRVSGIDAKVLPMSSQELNRPAPRPVYSVMAGDKLRSVTGRYLPRWQDALAAFITSLKV